MQTQHQRASEAQEEVLKGFKGFKSILLFFEIFDFIKLASLKLHGGAQVL